SDALIIDALDAEARRYRITLNAESVRDESGGYTSACRLSVIKAHHLSALQARLTNHRHQSKTAPRKSSIAIIEKAMPRAGLEFSFPRKVLTRQEIRHKSMSFQYLRQFTLSRQTLFILNSAQQK